MARLINRPQRALSRHERAALTSGPGAPLHAPISERRLEILWGRHRDELMAGPPHYPGYRPWGYWHFEAKRPAHLSRYPLDAVGEPLWGEAHIRAIDAHEAEPLIYLASVGELRDEEVETIREAALDASARIDTPREQRGPECTSKDRTAVRLAIRLDRALGIPHGDYGDQEPEYLSHSAYFARLRVNDPEDGW